MPSPRYLVGIDLGTTNTVVAFSEITSDLKTAPVSIFEIDQLIGPGEVVRKPLLPSFRYHPLASQFDRSDLTLPWGESVLEGDIHQVIIGSWARELGSKVEGRQIASAKSWLSHEGVDRESDILPWAAAQDVEKVSPVIASASYINHIKHSWNHHNPINRLEDQDVVITIPASFDETARSLTLKAANQAGLHNIVLLEEPQAVCYDWYARHIDHATEQLQDIPLILVCDVGGGTTDLSLIEASSKDNALKLNRIGVGEHLMLGGDNIDLALAHLAEQRFSNTKKLNAANLTKLIQQTRKAKELLLQVNSPEQVKITMLGSGSKLLGGTRSVALEKSEANNIIFDGFFPLSDFNALPDTRRSAVVEFGLPYASEPAVSKHIAAFLHQHQHVSASALQGHQDEKTEEPALPVGLLLNGGVFNSPLVTERLEELLKSWKGTPCTLLDNPHPDLSVAFGAVAFNKARRGAGVKIGGGSARSYFLHLPEKNKLGKALCLLAKGTEEGQEVRLTGRRFNLTLGEPVKFNLLTTTHDTLNNDQRIQNGLLVDVDPDIFKALPPYISTLDSLGKELQENQKERIEVTLASQLSEIGTLKLDCVSNEFDQHSNKDVEQRWNLEFEVRNQQATEEADAEDNLPPRFKEAAALISHSYSGNKKNTDVKSIKALTKDIEKHIGKRDNWDFNTSRQIFDTLMLGRKRRRRSTHHEKQWLRLAGFTLRPGFGSPTDTWRIEQIWSLYSQDIHFKDHQGWTDWWVCWRRIAGGLNQEQQETILSDIAKYLHPGAMKSQQSAKAAHEIGYESMVRLAASLEHLDIEDKTLLSNWFMNKAQTGKQFKQAHWWALGRLASRSMLYSGNNTVIPRAQVEQWLPTVLQQDWKDEPMAGFAAVMMSRMTGDRTLDISDDIRNHIIKKLKESKVPQSWIEMVSEVKELDNQEAQKIFGDTIPAGLILL
ncbi:hsp70 family protein [Vibrio sp.]|nr:hsp70 family protein [Vibrio sp.]